MASGDQYRFSMSAGMSVPSNRLTPVQLAGPEPRTDHVRWADGGIEFQTEGWYEVLLRVDWDTDDSNGTRFSHTKIPDQEPLHSEAISAAVLAALSDGRQLLRGNSLFGPDRTTSLVLEVWHDALGPVRVSYAELVIRELNVPWKRS